MLSKHNLFVVKCFIRRIYQLIIQPQQQVISSRHLFLILGAAKMMCQLEKPKEKRRKLAWAHAYAYDVEGKLHGVVVETSDSSDDDNYATPPLKVSESESDTKDDTGEKEKEGSELGNILEEVENLLQSSNLNPEEVHPGDKQDLQSVEPEAKEVCPVQLSPRSRNSRSFLLLFEGQEATHFEFIDNERLRRRFMAAAETASDSKKRETVIMSWIDENEDTKTNIRNG